MTIPISKVARKNVRSLNAYVPGKPIKEAQRELGLQSIIKLASNENPRGPSPTVLRAVIDSLPESNRYPDGNGYYLKQSLAKHCGVSPDCITLGNGSNDLLEMVASVFLGSDTNAVYSEHAFIIYALATARAGACAKVVNAVNFAHDLLAIADAVDENTRVIFLANPNNPTGTYFSEKELLTLLDSVSDSVLVVLDEAYFEYVTEQDYPNGLTLTDRYSNLIVTRTFSKAYGLSGFRVGYSISHPDVADLLNRVRQPFNVCSPALVAAQAALSDTDYIAESVILNSAGMLQLEQGLSDLGIQYIKSAGNFISFAPGFNAGMIEQGLLEKGVIVRGIAGYDMQDYLRVSIGLDAENQMFLEQLGKLLSEQSV